MNIVALDQVTDPHNVGAIIRSAVAFNFDAIILTEDNSPTDSGIMSKSSAGGVDLIHIIRVTNLATTLEKLKKHDFWVIGLDGDTRDEIQNAKPIDRKVVILGSEGNGMRRLTREKCDFIYKIPISSKMESLNVSNAAAIAFYELGKQ